MQLTIHGSLRHVLFNLQWWIIANFYWSMPLSVSRDIISLPKWRLFLCECTCDADANSGIVWHACVRGLTVTTQFILNSMFPRCSVWLNKLADYMWFITTIWCVAFTHILPQTKTIVNIVVSLFIYVWESRTTCRRTLHNAILRFNMVCRGPFWYWNCGWLHFFQLENETMWEWMK